MDARQMKAMTEATRLTREGRLVEATALIQQTLAGPAVPWRTPDAPSAGEETARTPGRHPATPPAAPGSGRRAGSRPSPTPTPPAPATTGSTCPPATTAPPCLWS
jgi:hypothetical protein